MPIFTLLLSLLVACAPACRAVDPETFDGGPDAGGDADADGDADGDGTGGEPGVIGGHGLRFGTVVPTIDAPVAIEIDLRPIPADTGDVGAAYKKRHDNPLVVEVAAR